MCPSQFHSGYPSCHATSIMWVLASFAIGFWGAIADSCHNSRPMNATTRTLVKKISASRVPSLPPVLPLREASPHSTDGTLCRARVCASQNKKILLSIRLYKKQAMSLFSEKQPIQFCELLSTQRTAIPSTHILSAFWKLITMSVFFRTLLLCLVLYSACARRPDYFSHIEPAAKTSWGKWGPIEWCWGKTFVHGMSLRVERPQGGGDDTSVNGVRLHCKAGGSITSKQGRWGGWEGNRYCSSTSFVVGVAIKSERNLGLLGDDTAANNFAFYCWDNRALVGTSAGTRWGTWSPRVNCPIGTAMCGIQTLVEKPQGAGDDTALNRAKFFCCRLAWNAWYTEGFCLLHCLWSASTNAKTCLLQSWWHIPVAILLANDSCENNEWQIHRYSK